MTCLFPQIWLELGLMVGAIGLVLVGSRAGRVWLVSLGYALLPVKEAQGQLQVLADIGAISQGHQAIAQAANQRRPAHDLTRVKPKATAISPGTSQVQGEVSVIRF